MAVFVRLTLNRHPNNSIWVNPDQIRNISPAAGFSRLYFGVGPGNYLDVTESPEEILAKADRAERDAR